MTHKNIIFVANKAFRSEHMFAIDRAYDMNLMSVGAGVEHVSYKNPAQLGYYVLASQDGYRSRLQVVVIEKDYSQAVAEIDNFLLPAEDITEGIYRNSVVMVEYHDDIDPLIELKVRALGYDFKIVKV